MVETYSTNIHTVKRKKLLEGIKRLQIWTGPKSSNTNYTRSQDLWCHTLLSGPTGATLPSSALWACAFCPEVTVEILPASAFWSSLSLFFPHFFSPLSLSDHEGIVSINKGFLKPLVFHAILRDPSHQTKTVLLKYFLDNLTSFFLAYAEMVD